MLSTLWSAFGPMVLGAVGGVIAFVVAIPTKIVDAILRGHFDRKLANFKAEQDKEMEKFKHELKQDSDHLKFQLDHLSDRGKLSNEKEYNALFEIWTAFIDAYNSINKSVISFIQHPDLRAMTQLQLDEFLEFTDFTKEQRAKISESPDRNELFTRYVELTYLNEAQAKLYKF